jgi:hypothetical protein
MELNLDVIVFFAFTYIFQFYFFNSLTLCSFSYYVVKSRASDATRRKFQERMIWPVRILFARNEYYATRVIMADDYNKYAGNLSEFFRNVTVEHVRKRQKQAAVLPIFLIIFQMVLTLWNRIDLGIAAFTPAIIVHFMILVLIVAVCFRFGNRLQSFAEREII